MEPRKTHLLINLTIACAFVLSGCATTPTREAIGHAKNMSMVDKYTLAGEKHLFRGYPPVDAYGNINVVVEIPSGTTAKWEVDKTTGQLKWEFKKGKPRVVSYLGYPGNYGMIPRTLLPKELGGDGDPVDVIVIGPAIPRGSVIRARPIGVLKMLDDGEQDDKIIAVLLNSDLGRISSIEELRCKFKGVAEILLIWFSNYKGLERMQAKGFGSATEARNLIKAAVEAYREELPTIK
jgi:inorganic pyrophosphatase